MLKPVAKNLTVVPPSGLQLCDANAFADVLGVSPAYRQKETIRWNSAMQMYKQMSSHDLTKPSEWADGLKENIDQSSFSAQSTESWAKSGVHENDRGHSSSPPQSPRSTSSKRSSVSTPFASVPICVRYGYVTPPAIPITGTEADYALGIAEMRRSISSTCTDSKRESLNALELEAIAAVHELQFVVKDIFVSELLPRTSELIFLNITTTEGQAYCIELTTKGWRVTSLRHDCMNGDISYINLHTKYFETIYALMDNVSDSYRDRFSSQLVEKLSMYVEKEPIKV